MMVISDNAADSTVSKLQILVMALVANLLNQMTTTVFLMLLLDLARSTLTGILTVKAFKASLGF